MLGAVKCQLSILANFRLLGARISLLTGPFCPLAVYAQVTLFLKRLFGAAASAATGAAMAAALTFSRSCEAASSSLPRSLMRRGMGSGYSLLGVK